ncbi:MAG TPA: terminase TerL endonuclease subunit [Caulobacteraceae bacterium]|jgi:phage terminase large subunit-like protein|nr:terminase TerL endonuclease subunit [Caulobacteraceae bacterium]
MDLEASAVALRAGHAEAFAPDRPDWLKAVDGEEAYQWARTAWDNAARQPGAWFDHPLAEAVVADWPKWATLTVDRFAGVPFKLGVWQEIVVRLSVGWMLPIEILDPVTHAATTIQIRLFRRIMMWIPRKNGKSEFLAALALLFFALDGVSQGEGYAFARKESQARIVFNRMAAMVRANKELAGEISVFAKSLFVRSLSALFVVLSGSTAGLHGPSPSVIVGDEMHEWRSLDIVETLRQGTGGRLQPIELYASTAGRKSGGHSVGEELYEESRQIADGRKDDPTTLVVIFAAGENDDPGDEATWRKANPSLGLSPTLHFLRQEFRKTIGNPRALAAFKCYHLGIWADEAVRWLPIKKWDACAASKDGWKLYPETLKGRKCFLAFDISATTDLTALVLVFPPTDDDPKWRVLSRFWVPEDQVERRVAEGAPIDKFIAAGAMETTPDDYVDQNAVGQAILEACRDYDVQKIAYDKWNALKLYTDLTRPEGLYDGAAQLPVELFKEYRQGIPSFAEPSKHFERLVYAGLFDHGGHPVLRWMAGHVVVHFDRNLNFMPAKDRSAEKIDGIVAAVMAVGLATAGETLEDMVPEDFEMKVWG